MGDAGSDSTFISFCLESSWHNYNRGFVMVVMRFCLHFVVSYMFTAGWLPSCVVFVEGVSLYSSKWPQCVHSSIEATCFIIIISFINCSLSMCVSFSSYYEAMWS